MARPDNRDQPYAERPMPGEHANDAGNRPVTRRQAEEEHAWSKPASWYGEGGSRGHSGLGPKGYVRTDERIRDYVCDDLMDDPWLDASAIEVTVRDGEATLSGTVDSDDARRLAEDVAEHAGGVKHVLNNLRVVDKPASD
jgi:osmotically-inducible protein OsmY